MVFIVVVIILLVGYGMGVIFISMVKILGKILCLVLVVVVMDLVWGYVGILLLG